MNMQKDLNERIKKAQKEADAALARWHAARDEARTDGTMSTEMERESWPLSELNTYGEKMAVAGELCDMLQKLLDEKHAAELDLLDE